MKTMTMTTAALALFTCVGMALASDAPATGCACKATSCDSKSTNCACSTTTCACSTATCGCAAPAAQVAGKQTMCPVMASTAVNPSIFADYNGYRVYFCCASCKTEFLKTPDKYMTKLQKDGVTLEKAPAAPAVKK